MKAMRNGRENRHMDVTVLDQLTAWAGEMLTRNLWGLSLDFGRFLIGAGSVYLIVALLLARNSTNRKIRSKTPVIGLTLMMLAQDAYSKTISGSSHFPQTFQRSRLFDLILAVSQVTVFMVLAALILLNLPLLGLAVLLAITLVVVSARQALHTNLGQ